jgi:hypothetical protein
MKSHVTGTAKRALEIRYGLASRIEDLLVLHDTRTQYFESPL